MSFPFSVTARKTLLRMQRRFYNFQMCSTCFWTEHSATGGKSQIVVTWSIFLDYWHPFKGTSSRTSFRFYQGLWGLFSSSLTDCRRALFSAMTAIVKKWHNSSSACECCLHRKSEMLCQKKSHPESDGLNSSWLLTFEMLFKVISHRHPVILPELISKCKDVFGGKNGHCQWKLHEKAVLFWQ